MFDARPPARPPDHQHRQSNNQVSPRENLVNKSENKSNHTN